MFFAYSAATAVSSSGAKTAITIGLGDRLPVRASLAHLTVSSTANTATVTGLSAYLARDAAGVYPLTAQATLAAGTKAATGSGAAVFYTNLSGATYFYRGVTGETEGTVYLICRANVDLTSAVATLAWETA